MRLSYDTQESPHPITLSIGTLRKPKLDEIFGLPYEKFNYYELFLKITPEIFYTKIKDGGKDYWESLSKSQKEDITLYDTILKEHELQNLFSEIFNFFFIEQVIFKDNVFLLLTNPIPDNSEITPDNLHGVIHIDIFDEILNLIQQICCINEDDDSINEEDFKNKTAKRLYEKMLKAQKKDKKKKKTNLNLSIPNIISAVSAKHPSLNYINIWNLTLFQLLDNFNRMQVNVMQDIDSMRVSVWGDEKKTFDVALWYKNQYDS